MSQFISKLAENYPVSGIRRMFDLAAGKQDIVNLCNGEPNFDTPENIKQAAIRSIEANQTRYAPEGGLPAFRKAVAEKYTKQFGRPFTEQNVMAAAGGVEGVILSFMTVLNPGDEVIIPDPAYTCYEGQAELLGAKVVRVPLKEEYGFRLQPEDLEAVITPKTKIVLLNYPSNPVGAVLTPEAGAALAEVILRHNLIVVSDEVYENILFDGRKHYSIAQAPGMENNTLVVNSLSKTYAMTGWRVGYVVSSNLEIMTKMVKMQQALISCLPGFVMAGAAEAISGSQDSVKYMSEQYARRRDLMVSMLSEVPGFKVFKTEGSFCVFINIKDYHMDSFEFCKELLEEAHVLTVPGTAFGSQGQGYIRMCFANSDENIVEGCTRIKNYLEKERILRMRGLFTFRYSDEQMQKLEALGIEITYLPEASLTQGTSLTGYDFLVCFNPFDRLDFTNCQLKWIHLVSKGVGHVPRFLQEDPDVTITNNVSGPSVPIGELIICYILEIFKNTRFFYRQQEQKLWKANPDILEITGKKICFLGTGLIAREAAARLRSWNAELIGLNTSGHEVPEFDCVMPIADLKMVLPRADVVISALPATPETFHLLNAETLSMIPKGATLINISRGSVIEENALCELLVEEHFRGVALDVFETEPLPENSPLWTDPRVIVTPHNALYSDWYQQRVFDGIYENARRFLAGDELCGVVDFKKGY